MASASGIAQSGLMVASLAVDVSANNIANALSEDFTPSRVAASEVEGGGVTGRVVPDAEAFEAPAAPPQDPQAEVRADRALLVPNRVDLAQELVSQTRAAAVYKANLETLKTDQEMQATLVQMLGK